MSTTNQRRTAYHTYNTYSSGPSEIAKLVNREVKIAINCVVGQYFKIMSEKLWK